MTINSRVLIYVGKVLFKQYPDIAKQIIDAMPVRKEGDLSKIKPYFDYYCEYINIVPNDFEAYNREDSERKKVFVCAMDRLYKDVFMLKTTLAETVNIRQGALSTILQEVKFRYDHDLAFKEKVDTLLNIIP